ncbi:hypothetical protein DBA29_20305 [Xenophilus aerolatus]|nr:hypothetical protein [Xenophilus aerolatus]
MGYQKMKFQAGHVPSHRGRTTATDPIKTSADVAKIKELIRNHVRNYALFTVAIGSALRGGDLTKLQWIDTLDDGTTITLKVLEGKTKKPRVIPLNAEASAALREWRKHCESEFIYSGQRGALTVAQWGRMLKGWCKEVGLEGRFSSHSARKTFCRVSHDEHDVPLIVLMEILNHSSPRQTMTYMGSLGDEVKQAYSRVI